METITITVTVSEPYTVIGLIGGTRRPIKRSRDYTATYNGKLIRNNSKATISGLIRQKAYRDGKRVRIEFVPE
jgi:hypothetical protein